MLKQNRGWIVALAAFSVAACVSVPQETGPPPPPVPASAAAPAAFEIRSIEFGEWGREEPAAIQSRFSRSVAQAVGRGETLPEALGALRANAFGCNPVSGPRGGDRPVHLCERQILQNGCTHTWQISLFDPAQANRAETARAIYDRVCSGETGTGGGLLGAPPG